VTLINPLLVNVDDEPDDYMLPLGHAEAGPEKFQKQTVKVHVCHFIVLLMYLSLLPLTF